MPSSRVLGCLCWVCTHTPPTQTTDKMCFTQIFCTEKNQKTTDCGNEHGVICLLHHNAGALQLSEIKLLPHKEKNSSLGYIVIKRSLEWEDVICLVSQHYSFALSQKAFLHYILYNNIKNYSDLHIAYPIKSYIKIYRKQMGRTNVSVHTMN